MIVYDPLYGRIRVPRYLADLAATPEVRRLSQVRLLNTASPTLPTLGELRRYSHTLGVLHLCSSNALRGFSVSERRALAATVLVHDVGTPAFGHLFEYHLREHSGWSHERIANAVLQGTATPENKAHQIFAGRTIEFRRELRKAKIEFDVVAKILGGSHPLSALLFGSLDFDNIDNVGRMAWGLGLSPGIDKLVQLATSIGVDASGKLTLEQELGRALVEHWAELRRHVYEIIVFDPLSVAAQAVLSRAMDIALRTDVLDGNDWYLTDEELITTLKANPATKDAVSEYWGRLPQLAFWFQSHRSLESLCEGGRRELHHRVEVAMGKRLKGKHLYGYSFEDRGTFGKEIHLHDPVAKADWSTGTTSKSLIVYGFYRARDALPTKTGRLVLSQVIDDLGLSTDSIIRTCYDTSEDADNAQCALDLAP